MNAYRNCMLVLLVAVSLSIGLLAQVPAGEDTALDYEIAGIIPESAPPLNASWKKCSLQGHGRLASITPYVLTFSFYDPATSGALAYPNSPHGETYPWHTNVPKVAFSAGAKNAIRAALMTASPSVYRDFHEVADTPTNWGQIRFFSANAVIGGWGRATLPLGDVGLDGLGDIVIRSAYDVPSTLDWRGYSNGLPGTQGYTNILHEIGHALGLKHPYQADAGIHDSRPDCYFPDGNDPNQDENNAPEWPPTPVGSVNPPAPSTILFCSYINGQYGYNTDNSFFSIMTYRFRNLCNASIPAESNFGSYDKPVLKDLYYYTSGW